MADFSTTVPPPPRPLTRAALRRSWAEMPVRIWCILAVTLCAIIIYFTISQIIAGAGERELIRAGTSVQAVVFEISNTRNTSAAFRRNEPLTAKVRFTLPNATKAVDKPILLSTVPTPEDGGVPLIHPGETLTLKVDPDNPNNLTDRLEPRSWLLELAVALMLLPVLALLVVVALLKRAQVLRIWQGGDAAEAVVVGVRQTAVAPFSQLVRLTLATGNDRRVFAALIPNSAGVPQQGGTVQVVMPRGNPGRAVLAKLYM